MTPEKEVNTALTHELITIQPQFFGGRNTGIYSRDGHRMNNDKGDLKSWEAANNIQTFDGSFYQYDTDQQDALREKKPWNNEYEIDLIAIYSHSPALFILRM